MSRKVVFALRDKLQPVQTAAQSCSGLGWFRSIRIFAGILAAAASKTGANRNIQILRGNGAALCASECKCTALRQIHLARTAGNTPTVAGINIFRSPIQGDLTWAAQLRGYGVEIHIGGLIDQGNALGAALASLAAPHINRQILTIAG